MLRVGLALLLLFATPALADDWGSYANARFGYSIDVPPGFWQGPESDNGDGRAFRDGASKLTVWGGNIVEADFEAEAKAAIGFVEEDGWRVTYQAVAPDWASFSGTQDKRIVYERMIAICDGQYGAFRLEYTNTELARMDPVINRLARSLKGSC